MAIAEKHNRSEEHDGGKFLFSTKVSQGKNQNIGSDGTMLSTAKHSNCSTLTSGGTASKRKSPRESHLHQNTNRLFPRRIFSALNVKQYRACHIYNKTDRILRRSSSFFNTKAPRENCIHQKPDRTIASSLISESKSSRGVFIHNKTEITFPKYHGAFNPETHRECNNHHNAFKIFPRSCLAFKQKKLLIILTVMLLTHSGNAYCPVSLETMKEVRSCPTDKQGWEEMAVRKNCSDYRQNCTDSLNFVYHCLPSMNHHVNVEVCAPMIYSSEYCCEFNTLGAVIQRNYDANCRNYSTPCIHSFPSTESFKYQECYTRNSQLTFDKNGDSYTLRTSDKGEIIGVCAVVLVVIGLVITVLWIRKTETGMRYIKFLPPFLRPQPQKDQINGSVMDNDVPQEEEKFCL